MSVFADSSAIVKLYADEPDCDRVRELEDALVVSQLTRVETASALWRKSRRGELTVSASALLVAEFESDWFGSDDAGPQFQIAALNEDVCETATRLVPVHRLRAYDAVQLATALRVREADPQTQTFAAFDRDLRDAAAMQGLTLLP